MASEEFIASAVVVPEPTAPLTSELQTSAKRRQSSVSEADSKRPRLSIDGGNGADADKGADSPGRERNVERRKVAQAEERKRGQRLFGGLLGTLSQSSSSKAQKRRAEIEKKQHERLKLQQSELDENIKRKRDRIIESRVYEQKKFDEQSMRIRHSNTLAMAHSLQTKTEPKLYYKPWELRPEEKEQIDNQVKEAEDAIEEELRQFEEKRDAERRRNSTNGTSNQADEKEQNESAVTVRQEASEIPESNERDADDTNGASLPQTDGAADEVSAPLNGSAASKNDDDASRIEHTEDNGPEQTAENNNNVDMSHENDNENHEDNGEMVLEAEEDTVIY